MQLKRKVFILMYCFFNVTKPCGHKFCSRGWCHKFGLGRREVASQLRSPVKSINNLVIQYVTLKKIGSQEDSLTYFNVGVAPKA